jgi:hypothetical protein
VEKVATKPIKTDTDKGMERVNARLNNFNEKDPIPFGYGEGELPYDWPGQLEFFRLVEDVPREEWLNKGTGQLQPPVRALRGHTLKVVCASYGVNFYIRIGFGPDRTLKIFAEDSEGREKIGEWQK